MRIDVVTLFPEFFNGPLDCGLMLRAREAGIVSVCLHNPRDAATDKHRTVDDRPYGGGPGMVMLAEPLAATLQGLGFSMRDGARAESMMPPAAKGFALGTRQGGAPPAPGRLIFLAPKGRPLDQELARELAAEDRLTLVCGRYEGIDARVEELFGMESVSVGDFVLNGGEAAALCLMESVARLLPGFMGHEDSGEEESFSRGLLEYPHYTRPEVFHGLGVPEALRSGDHGRVAAYRRRASLAVTLSARPELLSEAPLSAQDREFLRSLPRRRAGRNLYAALVHYPVLDKQKNSVAVSLTNLDIHDIARSSCTYGLGGYYVTTPLADQRRLLDDILAHWTRGSGRESNPDRDTALGLVKGVDRVEDAVLDIAAASGQEPLVVGTTAGFADKISSLGYADIRNALKERPVLLLFGTGHGLSPELHGLCHAFAPPVRGFGGYNHLSVRAAAAIVLDRILGDWR